MRTAYSVRLVHLRLRSVHPVGYPIRCSNQPASQMQRNDSTYTHCTSRLRMCCVNCWHFSSRHRQTGEQQPTATGLSKYTLTNESHTRTGNIHIFAALTWRPIGWPRKTIAAPPTWSRHASRSETQRGSARNCDDGTLAAD